MEGLSVCLSVCLSSMVLIVSVPTTWIFLVDWILIHPSIQSIYSVYPIYLSSAGIEQSINQRSRA